MKLLTFRHRDVVAAGVLREPGGVANLDALSIRSMLDVIDGGEATMAAIRSFVAGLPDEQLLRLDEVELLAPIPAPRKNVFCVGRNYVDHVKEGSVARATPMDLPQYPQFFTKPATAVVGPHATVAIGRSITAELDYEVELGVVIGKAGINIPAERALDHVFGYTVINDITGRDLQRRHDQWFKGKALDGSCPMGPWIVTRDAAPAFADMELTLDVDGEERQRARTSQMIFDVPAIIASLSAGLTLEAGDVIATGTPAGVGFSYQPPRFLEDGEVVTAGISGIGRLRNVIDRSN